MGVDLNLDYRGKVVAGMVAQPVDDYVVGVEIRSKPWILPRVETPGGPPVIPRCLDRHIIRTEQHVVAVEVVTRVTVHPRYVAMEDIRQSAFELIAEKTPQLLEQEDCDVVEVFAKRLARKLRRRGVTVR